MKQRMLVAGLWLVALSALAAGCGGNDDDGGGGSDSGTPAETAEGDHRGGTLTMLWSAPGASIDTAIAYDANWQVLRMTSDGLLGYKQVSGPEGTELVPDLAEAIPEPTDGGKTYRVQRPQGHSLLDRRRGQAERLHLHARAPVQGRRTGRRLLLQPDRRRRLRREAQDVRPVEGRRRRRRRGHA